jgi:hypothetical protein
MTGSPTFVIETVNESLFRYHLLIQSRAKSSIQSIGNFNASNGWFTRWLFNICKSVKLHGEAADIDLIEAESKMSVIREKNWLMPDTKQKTLLTWTKLA